MKKYKNKLSLVMAFLFLFSLVPQLNLEVQAASGISVDGVKDQIWKDMEPLATSDSAGWQGSDVGNFYLTNDNNNLYFWVDAKNVPNWGNEGQFIDIALNVNHTDSGYEGNPWSAPFNFSGTDVKPNIHILLRAKSEAEVAWASVYKIENGEPKEILNSSNLQNAAFAINIKNGFEGKIPLSLLGLEAGDKLKGIVVLSGNNGSEHGAFDVIPDEGNSKASSWNESANPNVQSVYSKEFTVEEITGPFVPRLSEIKGADSVVLGETTNYIPRFISEDGAGTDGNADEVYWSVTGEDGSTATNVVEIDENGSLTVKDFPSGTLATKIIIKAVRKSDETQVVTKTVTVLKENIPVVNSDGTVTFKAEHSGNTLYVIGDFVQWDTNKQISMAKDENGIFKASVKLTPGTYEYKFKPLAESWDGDFLDKVNTKTRNGNSLLIVPGLIINTASEVESGGSLDLAAKLLNAKGQEQVVTPVWSLERSIEGVSIEDNKLVVSKDVPADTKISLVATYDSFEVKKEITVVSQMYTYNIHYYRYDNEQLNWDLWIWLDGKEGSAYEFKPDLVDGFAVAEVKSTATKVNVIPRTKGVWNAQEDAKVIQIKEGKSIDVWIIEADDTIYYSRSEADIRPKVRAAFMDDLNKIYATTTGTISDEEAKTFIVKDENGQVIEATTKKLSDKKVEITVTDPSKIDVRKLYTVESQSYRAVKVVMRDILNHSKFTYSRSDLGVEYKPYESIFRVWAPTATKVSVVLYNDAGQYNEVGLVTNHEGGTEYEMSRSEEGAWVGTVHGDYENKYYMYKVQFADGTVNYAVDPYAKAVSANGQRGAIIDLDSTDPEDFEEIERPAMIKATDAILYELHVRDFSIDEKSGMDNKGTFKAFTEEGTTLVGNNSIKTGIDHLVELGITHVHLLPSYDYKTVNEMSKEAQYNWGYDPQNYNVPEGSYSTDATDPALRVTQFKEMVQALHENGIRVVMDVVYNHTYETTTSSFNLIVPGYYYRTDDNGKFTNGSGCGNEVASERPMVRKFIKDSVKYWANEYKVDGFRFDLMGLIDTTTMTEVTNELRNEVDPTILIYGEPWQAGGSSLSQEQQTLKGSQKDKGFAVFNDNFRGAIKGGSDDKTTGFANGASGKEAAIVEGVRGSIYDFTNSPSESINYVTAHDNLNLWDKFLNTSPEGIDKEDPYKDIDLNNVLANTTVKQTLLANGIILTSQGIPFFQAGDEFIKTKYGDHNSYKSPDSINKISWENKEKFKEVFDYYKGLIELRKSHPAFRMNTKAAVESNLEVKKANGNVVVFQLKNYANGDTWKNIVVIYNANTTSQEVQLPFSASWKVVVNGQKAGVEVLSEIDGNKVTVEPISMMVLYDEAEEAYESIPTTIELSKNTIGLEAGKYTYLTAVVKDQTNRIIPNAVVTWSADESGVVSVSKSGKITALKDGTALVTAKVGEATATVKVNVGKLVPTTINISGSNSVYTDAQVTLTATVKDQFDQILTTGITWSSSDESIATVNASGVVTGIKPGTVTIKAKAGDAEQELVMTVKKSVKRYIYLYYSRPDKDYTGWNLWVWSTGLSNVDGQVDFSSANDGSVVAKVEIAPGVTRIGFIVRKGNWDDKDIEADRSIEVDEDAVVTKVKVFSGVSEIVTLPSVTGAKVENGVAYFEYRDDDLFVNNTLSQLQKVQVEVNGQLYDMSYDEEDELYRGSLKLAEEGVYEYKFHITDKDGNKKVITDPKNTVNGKSIIEYRLPDMKINASVSSKAIDYSENAVLNIEVTSEDGAVAKKIYADLSALGGPDKVEVDTNLMSHTISVRDNVTAGDKKIAITVVDQFGNEHKSEATVTVKTRQYVGNTDFDWDEARIYFMLTDRFYNGDTSNDDPNGENYDKSNLETYHGGDFKGITKKLDYLQDLGINTIWITPIVDNIDFNQGAAFGGLQYAYHGYWAKDFEKIDEHLGDVDDLKELIDEAHDRGIKIMIDVVLNHVGYGMRSTDTNSTGVSNYPTAEEKAKFDGMLRDGSVNSGDILSNVSGLPDLLTENPEVREKIIQWQSSWIDILRTEKGNTIDYFRIDTVKHVDNTTWKAFKNAVTTKNPKAKFIGEVFGADINNQYGQLRSGQMDSLLDFSFKYSAQNFVNGKINDVEAYLEEVNDKIDNTATLGLFLSSHDEDGFLIRLGNMSEEDKLAKLKAAVALQMTAKGQPIVYYGEELGASGRNAGNMAAGELSENRYDMPWDRLNNPLYMSVHDHYKKLLNIRADYSKIFAKGSRTQIGGSDAEKYLVFKRTYNEQSVVVAINTDTSSKNVTVEVPFEAGAEIVDLYSGTTYTVGSDQKVSFTLPAIADGATVILAKVKEESEEPGTGGEEPGSGEEKPGTGEEHPGSGEEKPGTGGEQSGTGEEKPSTGKGSQGTEEKKTDDQQLGSVVKNDQKLIIEAIKNASNGSTIVVDASSNKRVDKSIFEAIKGTDKFITFRTENAEWTFYGKDIKIVKDIDLTILIASLKDTVSDNKDAIAKKVNNEDVLVLTFASNGELPGKATVRVKMDSTWLANKNKNNMYVYYYNEKNDKAKTIAKQLKVDADGYIEFAIDHNSDFFVADKDLVATGVLPKTGSPIDLNTVFALGILTVLAGVVVLFTRRKKFNK
ncbi:Pullulanase precursor [Clostridium sp. N3C]|uniref:type I pullulanase n=1 Tax=Clostridium sp. N3C TaxID=1776758 RepID=UPI00092DF739|nr:type I pullulanase [Clostridium sp. N3C]SCN24518.1 Pullulanase precursor [Clostridium sp. N3C]